MAVVLPRGRWLLLVLSVKEGSGGQMVGVIFLSLSYFLLSACGTVKSFGVRDEEFHLYCHCVLHLKVLTKKKKACTNGSCKLNFTWGTMRTAVWETAPWIALRDCSKRQWGKVSVCDCGEGEVHIVKHLFHKSSSAGHEELMPLCRDLVLF